MFAEPEIEISAIATEVIVAATAAISNCFFILKLLNFISNTRLFLLCFSSCSRDSAYYTDMFLNVNTYLQKKYK
jgi:hypothetical protein